MAFTYTAPAPQQSAWSSLIGTVGSALGVAVGGVLGGPLGAAVGGGLGGGLGATIRQAVDPATGQPTQAQYGGQAVQTALAKPALYDWTQTYQPGAANDAFRQQVRQALTQDIEATA